MAETNWNLKRAIGEQFRTQYDFATAIKADHTLISLVVNGRRKLDDKAKKLWARKLKSTVAELFD